MDKIPNIGRYDYSKTVYVNSYTKVIITCRVHGDFKQTPANHLNGHGCPSCTGHHVPNTKECIEKFKKIHGDRYDYTKVVYVKALSKVIIICKKHGEFQQKPSKHMAGQGCVKCQWISSTDAVSFKTARIIVRKLRIKKMSEWHKYSKSDARLKDNIPSRPDQKYKDSGWISWKDFLGTNNK